MTLDINSSPHEMSPRSSAQIMLWVVVACAPALLASCYYFGWGTLINILWAGCVGLILESILALMRGRSVGAALTDNSALLTAVLLGFAVPPGTQWWLIVIALVGAIVLAKHLFGGLGQNLFNPAMTGYAILLISFPVEMTSWKIPGYEGTPGLLTLAGFTLNLQLVFPFLSSLSVEEYKTAVDGYAMATPLLESKLAGSSAIADQFSTNGSLFSRQSEVGWEWINLGFLGGGLILLGRRIISWHIPVSMLTTIFLLSLLILNDTNAFVVGSSWLHLLGGATMIGAFFIATDPVTAPASNQAKILYGIIIGIGVYSIRVWGSYLDSIAFAVLFANLTTPLLDHFIQPRTYGHTRKWWS